MDTAAAHRPRIHCSAEWHLRESPRAIAIYHLALRLTGGGKREFMLSQPQLATYFDWDIKTVRDAFVALRGSGLFKLLRGGTGGDGQANFANVYGVITHSKLPKADHWVMQEVVAQPEQELVGEGENGRGGLPETGRGGLPKTGTLVYEQSTSNLRGSDAMASANQSASPTPKPKHSYFPSNFAPNDNNRALARKLSVNLQESFQAFTDYCLSNGTRHVDWHRALNTWIRNDRRWDRGQPKRQEVTGSALDNMRALEEKYK